jgi:hypothetical protein
VISLLLNDGGQNSEALVALQYCASAAWPEQKSLLLDGFNHPFTAKP